MTLEQVKRDAPERIGLISDGLGLWALAEKHEADIATHYVRADIARSELEAAVLAEREACAGMADKEHQALMTAMRKNPETHVSDWSMIADAIRARKP